AHPVRVRAQALVSGMPGGPCGRVPGAARLSSNPAAISMLYIVPEDTFWAHLGRLALPSSKLSSRWMILPLIALDGVAVGVCPPNRNSVTSTGTNAGPSNRRNFAFI